MTILLLLAPWLLVPGTFHGDEVRASGGEKVWALRNGELVEATLEVELVKDELLDAADQKTGKRVSVAKGELPVAMFGDLKLEAGPVTTRVSKTRSLVAGQPVAFTLGARTYRLEAAGDENGYRLTLTEGSRTQTLVTHDTLDDAAPRLLWAGDLDRDGQADFLIDLTRHYNVSQPTLFLSKDAGEGDLVRRAAAFRSVGC